MDLLLVVSGFYELVESLVQFRRHAAFMTSQSLFCCFSQSFPVMVGDMDNTGSLNAQIIHQLTTAVRSKIAIQVCPLMDLNTPPVPYFLSSLNSFSFFFLFSIHSIHVLQTQQHKFVNWQCDLEYRGEDFTTAVTLGNPDVVVGSGTAFLF